MVLRLLLHWTDEGLVEHRNNHRYACFLLDTDDMLNESSEELLPERRLEAHVLGALDGEPVPRVVVHHLWHRHEPPREVAQLELAARRVPPDPHVHEAPGAPRNCIK